jgi:hypothetical protein
MPATAESHRWWFHAIVVCHVPIVTRGVAYDTSGEHIRQASKEADYVDPELWTARFGLPAARRARDSERSTCPMRIAWTSLPEAVTNAVADWAGGSHIVPAATGDHAEIAATVTGTSGKVFVKAAHTDFGVRSLRFELQVSEAVNGAHSPAVEWHFEAAGWLVVGFEHCDGPHADLSPGSADLDLLGAVLTMLGETPAPHVSLFSPTARLGFEHPAMDGGTLVHTDLGPANLIMTGRGLRIVDWAMATKAAAWVELAMLTPWLIGAGHTPEQAEQWLARQPAWRQADPEVLGYFAAKNAQKWASKSAGSTTAWMRDLAAWTSRWTTYRCQPARPPTGPTLPTGRP